VRSLGLDELTPFDPHKKIIEYLLMDHTKSTLADKTLQDFAQATAAETPTPGGGSVSAYVGSLGAALGTMVANLSAHKQGWEDRWQEFSKWAEQGQQLQTALLRLVDADTDAFNSLMDAFRLPKTTDSEKQARSAAIQSATTQAIEIPLEVMRTASKAFDLLDEMVHQGNPNSISDGAVGALCTRAAIRGAGLNVMINLSGIKDEAAKTAFAREAQQLIELAETREGQILDYVHSRLG